MYAAANDGRLPADLADTPVPAPIDPVTGKAFQYRTVDGGFELTCPAPSGHPPGDGDLYKVTLRKAASREN